MPCTINIKFCNKIFIFLRVSGVLFIKFYSVAPDLGLSYFPLMRSLSSEGVSW